MISNEYVICPYCKSKHNKGGVIGQSGIINIFGTEKELLVEIVVKISLAK